MNMHIISNINFTNNRTTHLQSVYVCVCTCRWIPLSIRVLYEVVTDAWCLLELDYLWFDNI